MFLAAAESTGAPPERLIMVGDDLESDVLAAQALGMVGVQVRTGKFRQQTLDRSPKAPDHVIDSIADLLGLIDA